MIVDTETEFGARVARRLREDRIVWLTTSGVDQTPQPSPVWFLWDGDGETILIYSQPGAPKVRNIGRSPRVAVNLNSDEHGGDVVVLTGEAVLDEAMAGAPPADYFTKYAEGLKSLGMTDEAFAAEYATAIRIRPTKLRGF
jgi:PPOX class probable F420-dependent enzyme